MFYVLGWGRLAASPPTYPIPYKENIIICHSERSEESTVFFTETVISFAFCQAIISSNLLNFIHLNFMNYSAPGYFYTYLIFSSTSRTENQMLVHLFTLSPSCASLTGGYSHLAPIGAKTYSVMFK